MEPRWWLGDDNIHRITNITYVHKTEYHHKNNSKHSIFSALNFDDQTDLVAWTESIIQVFLLIAGLCLFLVPIFAFIYKRRKRHRYSYLRVASTAYDSHRENDSPKSQEETRKWQTGEFTAVSVPLLQDVSSI